VTISGHHCRLVGEFPEPRGIPAGPVVGTLMRISS